MAFPDCAHWFENAVGRGGWEEERARKPERARESGKSHARGGVLQEKARQQGQRVHDGVQVSVRQASDQTSIELLDSLACFDRGLHRPVPPAQRGQRAQRLHRFVIGSLHTFDKNGYQSIESRCCDRCKVQGARLHSVSTSVQGVRSGSSTAVSGRTCLTASPRVYNHWHGG